MEILNFVENFKNILDDTDVSKINLNTPFRELEEWSSLTALSLIAMVDEEYSVKLTGEEIKSSKTLNDLYNIIKNKK
jgi:acyl carrier protein